MMPKWESCLIELSLLFISSFSDLFPYCNMLIGLSSKVVFYYIKQIPTPSSRLFVVYCASEGELSHVSPNKFLLLALGYLMRFSSDGELR